MDIRKQQRVSDNDREPYRECLRKAYADDRISKTELDDRLTAVGTAITQTDLAYYVSDLPDAPAVVSAKQKKDAATQRRETQRAMWYTGLVGCIMTILAGAVTMTAGPCIIVATAPARGHNPHYLGLLRPLLFCGALVTGAGLVAAGIVWAVALAVYHDENDLDIV